MVLFDTCNFQPCWQEVEIWLSDDARVYCLIILTFLLFWLVDLHSFWVKNRYFFVQDSLKSFGKIAAVLDLHANLGKGSHIVVNLAIQVVLFGHLKYWEFEHEFTVFSKTKVDMMALYVVNTAVECLAELVGGCIDVFRLAWKLTEQRDETIE